MEEENSEKIVETPPIQQTSSTSINANEEMTLPSSAAAAPSSSPKPDQPTEADQLSNNQIQVQETNVSPKCANNNQSCSNSNNNCNKQHKNSNSNNNANAKKNNRRRKRSFRVRKNSGNFKFNPKSRSIKRRNGNVIFTDDQAQTRHKLFFTDSQRLVPYNTNEFLMDDHYPKISPNFNYQPYTHDSFSSSDCGMSGSLDEDEFLTREFRMDYENLRSEQLHDMSKDQLIEEYIKLESQTEMTMKSKENEILALNNKIKGKLMTSPASLTRIDGNVYVKFKFPLFLLTKQN